MVQLQYNGRTILWPFIIHANSNPYVILNPPHRPLYVGIVSGLLIGTPNRFAQLMGEIEFRIGIGKSTR